MKRFSVTLGPPIPIVPVTDFTRLKLSSSEWEQAWQLVGPSVERNIAKNAPLWMIIASAYLEGLDHGSSLTREQATTPEPPIPPSDHHPGWGPYRLNELC